jgi:autotransporter-associated beta strand protein
VTVTLGNPYPPKSGGAISTEGYAASGVIAQSIGGGGGMAADGSDGAWGYLAVGLASSGSGGAAGNGGSVTLTTALANTITTKGEAAHAVLLQSVGGGGGLAGAGSSFDLSNVRRTVVPKTSLGAGGGPGASGAGDTVTFNDQGTIAIKTSGNNAFGIVAQSIGGGGIVAVSQAETAQAIELNLFEAQIGGVAGEPNNNGGQVSVTLNTGSSIGTAGTGAHGIVAQSIGGGGGISGLPGTTPLVTTAAPSGKPLAANGNGNTVTITNGAAISVTGAGAVGILAQSIGSGGGLLLEKDGNTVFAGSPAASLSGSGGHGNRVTVSTTGSITASGTNGIGIFAQSTGHTASEDGPITVTVDAAVVGGNGKGAAIQIDSPTGSPDGTVNVGSKGALSAASGVAILASGGVKVNVDNKGSISGEVELNGGTMNNSGAYNPGPTLEHDLLNTGLVIVSGATKVVDARIDNRGILGFRDASLAGDAIITTGVGGLTGFMDGASGGRARFITDAGGTFDISLLSTAGTTAGSIEGAGTYYLGSKQFIVGGNDSSTTVSGVISDGGQGRGTGGSLVKVGNGVLTLTGANTYTGGTQVLQGTLQGNSTSLQGNILNNAALIFNQAGMAGTYAGVISGSGAVSVIGGGMVSFTGNHTYTGPTTVSAGMLSVNGSLASTVILPNGGILGGNGVIAGLVQTGGVLAPGSSIGTLMVNGNVNVSGGTYQVEVNPQGQSDRVNISGTATISGVTVQVLPQSGTYQRNGGSYTILNAQGGVSGGYAGASISGFAFLSPVLGYDANNVYLTLATAYTAGAQTSNQRAVGAALDQASPTTTGGDFNTVLNALANLNTQLGPAALNTISGQPIADFGTVNIEGASLFMNALGQQMALARGGAGGGQRLALAEACEIATCEGATSPWSVWGSALGGLGSVQGDGNAGTLTYNFGGAAVGLDYRLDPRFLVGLGVGYAHGTQWVNGFSGQSWTDSVSVAAYGSFTQAGFYADLLAGYAYSGNQIQRQILIPGLSARMANGSTGANQFLGQLETGYQVPIWAPATATLTPFARLQGSTVGQNGFGESGAQSLNLNVAQQTTNSLRTTFGAELAGIIPLGAARALDLAFRAGWQHEYASTARPITAAFNSAPFAGFTVYGATPSRDAAIVGFSAKTRITDAMQLYLRYDGQLGGGTDNHALNVGLRMSW